MATMLGVPQTARPAAPTATEPHDDESDREALRILTIEEIDIVGRRQVSTRLISRLLEAEHLVVGGQIRWPSDDHVQRVRSQLRATGYFKRVNLKLDPVAGSLDRVRLVIELEERSSIMIDEVYLGSSRLTPLRVGASAAERNFAGRGILLGGAILGGTLPRIGGASRQQAYKLFFEVPRFGKLPFGLLGNAYFISASEPYRVAGEEDDPNPALFEAVDVLRFGGVFGFTFPVVSSLTFGADYRVERVDAFVPNDLVYHAPDGRSRKIDLALERGTHYLTSAHLGLVWDGREDTFLAGQGGRFGFDLQISSPALGSDYEYIKFVAAGAYTFRLPWGHWLTPRVSGGQIAGRAPRFEQFYSGDLSAWTPGREQGLRFSTRNPIDVFGTGIDRREFGVLFGRVDLEYVVPVFRRTRTRAIYGGDVYFSLGVFTLAEGRERRHQRQHEGERVAPVGLNADIGIRLDTAIGSFNFSVGNALRRAPL